MEKLRFMLSFLALILAASFALSCGASSHGQNPLQSITLSPATADAQNYPNGEVQFTATGHYINPSRSVTPLSAGWGTCYQDASTSEVSVTSGGVAKCATGAIGTYTVWANDPPFPNVGCLAITACGGGCFIAGSAQLTCP
ncbi:MAG: hypothetical protein ABSG23_07370 [Terriglobales bacterium]|jgi:hypothetical protein